MEISSWENDRFLWTMASMAMLVISRGGIVSDDAFDVPAHFGSVLSFFQRVAHPLRHSNHGSLQLTMGTLGSPPPPVM